MKRRNQNTKQKASSEPKRQRTTSPVARQSSTRGSKSPPLPITYLATFSLADQSFAYVLSSSIIAQSPYLESAINLQTPKKRQGPIVSLTIPLNEAFETYWPGQDPKTVFPCLERALSFLSLGFQTDVWRLVDQETMGLIVTLRGLAKFLQMSVPPLNVSSMDMTDPSRWLLIDTFDSITLPALFEQWKSEKAKSEFAKAYIGLDISVQRELYRRLFTAEMSLLVSQLGYSKLYCELARSTYQAAQLTGFRKDKCKSTCGKINQTGGTFALNPNFSIEEWSHGIISYTDLQAAVLSNAKLIGDLSGLITGQEPCKVLYVLYDRTRFDRRNLRVDHTHFEIITRDYVEYIFRDFDFQLRFYDLAIFGKDASVDELLMGMAESRYQACLDTQCMTLYGTMGFFDAVAEGTHDVLSDSTTITIPQQKADTNDREKWYREKVERALVDRRPTHNLSTTFANPLLPIPRWIMCESIEACPIAGLAWRHLHSSFYIACQRTKDGLLPLFIRAQQLRSAIGAKWIMEGPVQTSMARRIREILQLLGNPVSDRVRHHSDSCSCEVEIVGRNAITEKALAGHVWFCFIGETNPTDRFRVELHHPSEYFVNWSRAAFKPTTPLEIISPF
eukprot:GILK01008562.1.p1 GENE.GILK01008562.1~~GILK01008562.1.p1  ORF type:complete len:619 (-),score=49.10 GILK01008562.1:43-1899(-)